MNHRRFLTIWHWESSCPHKVIDPLLASALTIVFHYYLSSSSTIIFLYFISVVSLQVVEWEFWTNSNDMCGVLCDKQRQFVKDIKPNAVALQKAVRGDQAAALLRGRCGCAAAS